MSFIYPYYFMIWNDIDIIHLEILYLIGKIIDIDGINNNGLFLGPFIQYKQIIKLTK